jgi:aspartate racemase
MQHPIIGIIAATTPGAAICVQHLVQIAAQKGLGNNHPEYFIHDRPTQDYLDLNIQEDWEGTATLILDSVYKLEKLGANLFIMPSNTPHYAWPMIEAGVNKLNENLKQPVIFINLITTTVEYCLKNKYEKVLLLGTSYTMRGDLYKKPLASNNISCIIPNESDIDFIEDYIKDHLIKNEVNEQKTEKVIAIINDIQKTENCDAIILGCTELPMILTNEVVLNHWNKKLHLVDTTYILAEKAMDVVIDFKN